MDGCIGETSGQSAAFLGDGCSGSVHSGNVCFGVGGCHHGVGYCWFNTGLDEVEALLGGDPGSHSSLEDVVPFFLDHVQGVGELGFPV